jgi:flagellar basal body-associated protein FliL
MSSDTPETPAKPKGKGKALVIVLSLLLAGAAGGGGAVALGYVPMPGGETKPAPPPPPEPPVYVELTRNFTSNLRDGGRFVQTSIAVSTRGQPGSAEILQAHEVAVRSAILAQIANTGEDEVASIEGRERMALRLRDAANAALKTSGAEVKIERLYFTAFVIQ